MIKVLVVDDSHFFHKRITERLNFDPKIEVIGDASNEEEALVKVRKLRPDIVTMGIEMPNMDEIEAVKKIITDNSLPILMFSFLTNEGADATLEALSSDAADFLTK